MPKIRFALCFLLATVASSVLHGQSAQPTVGALLRTVMIHTVYGFGTAFSIDVDNREYWFTAKHVLTGVERGPAGNYKPKTATVSLLSNNAEGPEHNKNWFTETFTVIDPGKDIDILVLVPDHLIVANGGSMAFGSEGLGYGADCEFLGFPYAWAWETDYVGRGRLWLPFAKHCTVSARITQGTDVWVLDGINNKGFSGGPVIFKTGNEQKVFAVVSGYDTEPLEVLPAETATGEKTGTVPPPPPLPGKQKAPAKKLVVETNSGFIVAFNLQSAIDAIRQNPIGPLRDSK